MKIRWSHDHLIFIMGITIPGKDSLYIETGLRCHEMNVACWKTFVVWFELCIDTGDFGSKGDMFRTRVSWTFRPNDERIFSPLNAITGSHWLWRYVHIFVIWCRLCTVRGKWFPIEWRQVILLWWSQDSNPGASGTHSPADWMRTLKPGKLSRINLS